MSLPVSISTTLTFDEFIALADALREYTEDQEQYFTSGDMELDYTPEDFTGKIAHLRLIASAARKLRQEYQADGIEALATIIESRDIEDDDETPSDDSQRVLDAATKDRTEFPRA